MLLRVLNRKCGLSWFFRLASSPPFGFVALAFALLPAGGHLDGYGQGDGQGIGHHVAGKEHQMRKVSVLFRGARYGVGEICNVKIPPQSSGVPNDDYQQDIQQDESAPALSEQYPGDEQQVVGIEDYHARQGNGYVSQVPGQGNGFFAVLPPHQQGKDQQQPPSQQVDGNGQQGGMAFLGHQFHGFVQRG